MQGRPQLPARAPTGVGARAAPHLLLLQMRSKLQRSRADARRAATRCSTSSGRFCHRAGSGDTRRAGSVCWKFGCTMMARPLTHPLPARSPCGEAMAPPHARTAAVLPVPHAPAAPASARYRLTKVD